MMLPRRSDTPAIHGLRLAMAMRVDSDGVTILVYRSASDTSSRLGFGPDLLWAREVLDGAERDLLVR